MLRNFCSGADLCAKGVQKDVIADVSMTLWQKRLVATSLSFLPGFVISQLQLTN